ncbi:RNase A-like domain-containing protein [Streptomyces sp. QL37]|uniref:RNase A-like domain-containing protein n=1 Tax=Streptomyces sp. QL37 TaxID=2093747 RepID=UPI0011B000E3|nr:RNase A-like domain-containing protein [Streptomyces sp. QL37]
MAEPTPGPSPSATPPADSDPPKDSPGGAEPTPEPSPGSLEDPQGRDISRHDSGSAERERRRNVEELKPAAPPDAGGGFDISPGHVYYASGLVSNEQFEFDKSATLLVDAVGGWSQTQVAGRGHGADAFAAAYADVADSFLQLWAKTIMSIEGVIVGLTVTANNYQRADWAARQANRQHRGEEPPHRSPPATVGRTTYQPVSSIKWTGTGDDSGPILAWAGNGPDWLAEQIDEAMEHVLRLGKTVEITPGARTGELRGIGDAWLAASKAAKASATNFTSCIAYLTDGGNSEWQGAMNSFCQSIWGTTAWGGTRGIADAQPAPRGAANSREWRTNPSESPAGRRPIIEVLARTGETLHRAFHDAADAADKSRKITSQLGVDAANATVKDLTVGLDLGELTRLGATLAFGEITATFAKHMDKAGADAAVEACHNAFHEAARKVRGLEPELKEASWSAPTFAAEEARARAFGARALDEFKPRHRWTRPGHTDLNIYQIDLASTEWLENSHTVNKHVGLTDEQLAQRLRDDLKKPPRPGTEWEYGQPKVARASAFKDIDSAQRMTQYTIDDNQDAIKEWIERQPDAPERLDIRVSNTANPDEYSGRSIDKQEIKASPFPADKAVNVKGVETRLVYNRDLDPPFTVLSSMPAYVKEPST